jgi:hypothetical protein
MDFIIPFVVALIFTSTNYFHIGCCHTIYSAFQSTLMIYLYMFPFYLLVLFLYRKMKCEFTIFHKIFFSIFIIYLVDTINIIYIDYKINKIMKDIKFNDMLNKHDFSTP